MSVKAYVNITQFRFISLYNLATRSLLKLRWINCMFERLIPTLIRRDTLYHMRDYYYDAVLCKIIVVKAL